MICELLGVPHAERERFQHHSVLLTDVNLSEGDSEAAFTALREFLYQLVLAKRTQPTDDLLGDLLDSDLTDEELTTVGLMLLGAGLDTTTHMLGLGTFPLLRNPEQLAALRGDPGMAAQAVEELLRHLSIIPNTVRAALEDVELDGNLIKAGDAVTISIHVANRDPGIHQCLDQRLARVECGRRCPPWPHGSRPCVWKSRPRTCRCVPTTRSSTASNACRSPGEKMGQVTRYVALLQGINLGARRRIAMADLRALLGELGYADASTYLQSGNALFTAPSTADEELTRTIEEAIAARFGFSVPCLVRDEPSLTRVIESNPLAEIATDPKRYLVTFLSGRPDPAAFENVDPRDYEPEAFALGEREIFTWHPDGIRDSEIAKVFTGKRLGDLTATARNWNAVTRLHRLISGAG